ncbi:MAG: VirB4 family type IV secretion system protein [Mycobacteriales bacterium]
MRFPLRLAAWPGQPADQPETGAEFAAAEFAAAVGPDVLHVAARHVGIGDELAATLIVTGYPAEVGPGWLEPLLSYPGRLDVALHIDPIPQQVAAERLRRQRARLESGRRQDTDRDRLDDPELEAAAEDARELAYRVARGEGKLFRVGLYLTIHADSEDQLAEELVQVRAVAESLLLRVQPATFRAMQGWTAALPLGLDPLKVTRTFDTTALAAAFPFTSPDLPAADPANTSSVGEGVLYGANLASAGLVFWDRFDCDNHNSITLGRSGSGKSYLTKLEVLRSLYRGVQVYVVDPEDEYAALTSSVGGSYLHLGATEVRLNPLDLPASERHRPDALTRRALFLHTFLQVLLGQPLQPRERAVLDRAILTCYQQAGITNDPRTWHRQAPILSDLAAALTTALTDGDPVGAELAARLAPYVDGSHAGLFNGPTTTRPEGHLVAFSLRDLADEAKPAATLLVLDAIWRQVSNPADRRRRLVVVDEAWLLLLKDTDGALRAGQGAQFLFRMAKAARKHCAGLAVVTQDVSDVLDTPLGQAVAANATTQLLLRQAPQVIDQVSDRFGLSAGEREFLLTADRGEALLVAGRNRVAFHAIASAFEHHLAVTGIQADPTAATGWMTPATGLASSAEGFHGSIEDLEDP